MLGMDGAKKKDGYGQLQVAGKMVLAHRFSYGLENGSIPDGLSACHRCDNPGCCNPNHIFLGTHADNMHDKERKGRGNHASGDRHGARLHPERAARGERNGQAKLTTKKVVSIRADYASGGTTYKQLATRYGVSFGLIGFIVRGKNWKHTVKERQ